MGIESDSTFADVVLDTIADYVPSETDLESWVELKPATGDDVVTTTVGLFGGNDLTTFNENCAIASDDCDVADYEKYSGWAIGIKWTAADAAGGGGGGGDPCAADPTASGCPMDPCMVDPTSCRLRQAADEESSTVIFEDTSRLVEVVWGTTENEIWNADVKADPIVATLDYNGGSDDSDFDWEDDFSTSPFDGTWFGELQDVAAQEQFAITFQEDEADVYYEVGDTVNLWVHKDYVDGKDTEVTWGGAAQLTAAASVIVASLLF